MIEVKIKFFTHLEERPVAAGPYLVYFRRHGVRHLDGEISWFDERNKLICTPAFFDGFVFYNPLSSMGEEIYEAVYWAEFPEDITDYEPSILIDVCNCPYCQYLREK